MNGVSEHIPEEQQTSSHWWGFAALPDGVEYPYNGEGNPLTLVCQLHYGEGMIYVFADLDYFFGDIESDGGHIGEWGASLYKVLYSHTREGLHTHEIRYENGEPAVPKEKPIGNMLHGPTCFIDELEQDYPDYQVLVQLDEDDEIGLRFYDCGCLFFLIRPEDLEAKRFDRTKCVLYSY